MKCRTKVVQLNEIYMCTEFHMNMCKYVWAIHQVFRLCSRGRRRAPVPRPGPSLCCVQMAADSNVCVNFHEFLIMLGHPKTPGRLKKKKILRGTMIQYSCKQRWRAQAVSATATPVASQKRGTASSCIYSNPLAVWF